MTFKRLHRTCVVNELPTFYGVGANDMVTFIRKFRAFHFKFVTNVGVNICGNLSSFVRNIKIYKVHSKHTYNFNKFPNSKWLCCILESDIIICYIQ